MKKETPMLHMCASLEKENGQLNIYALKCQEKLLKSHSYNI